MVCVYGEGWGGIFLVNILNDCLTVVHRISQCRDSAYTQHNNNNMFIDSLLSYVATIKTAGSMLTRGR